jgi:hypothetical protein
VESHNNEKKVCYLLDASFGGSVYDMIRFFSILIVVSLESTYEVSHETAHIYVEVNLRTGIAHCFECGQFVTSRHVTQPLGEPETEAKPYILILIDRGGKSPSGILAEEMSTEAILPIALEELNPVLVGSKAKILDFQKFLELKKNILMRYPLGHKEKASPSKSETVASHSRRYPTRVHRLVRFCYL